MEQVAYFLKRLKSLDEGGTSLLDNSMVMFGCGIKCGNLHLEHDLPIAARRPRQRHACAPAAACASRPKRRSAISTCPCCIAWESRKNPSATAPARFPASAEICRSTMKNDNRILALASCRVAAFAQTPPPQPPHPPRQPPAGRGGGAAASSPCRPGPNPNSQYRLGPDSMPQEGVPKGEIRGPFVIQSNVYPGTQHTYWVYVPAQYDPAVPASLMVFQDGQAFKDENGDLRTQNVMDNLIYRREIPVMIGVFINPGRRPDQLGAQPADRLGRWHHQSRHRVQHARR